MERLTLGGEGLGDRNCPLQKGPGVCWPRGHLALFGHQRSCVSPEPLDGARAEWQALWSGFVRTAQNCRWKCR